MTIVYRDYPVNFRYATHEETVEGKIYWSGYGEIGGLIVKDPETNLPYTDPENEFYGKWWIEIPEAVYDFEIPADAPYPGAAWWLYDREAKEWVERAIPDNWDGLVAGGNDA